jgi:SAM-dependent methyltransferase
MDRCGDTPLALSFGVVAETYNDVRPPYFVPLVDRAYEVLDLDSRSRVLDLGAGTGRLTRELVGLYRSVIAVEPDDEMRALIFVGTVLAGAAEAIPLADASVDGVFVGEVPLVRCPARGRRDRARPTPARRAGGDLDALVGDDPTSARACADVATRGPTTCRSSTNSAGRGSREAPGLRFPVSLEDRGTRCARFEQGGCP